MWFYKMIRHKQHFKTEMISLKGHTVFFCGTWAACILETSSCQSIGEENKIDICSACTVVLAARVTIHQVEWPTVLTVFGLCFHTSSKGMISGTSITYEFNFRVRSKNSLYHMVIQPHGNRALAQELPKKIPILIVIRAQDLKHWRQALRRSASVADFLGEVNGWP